MIFRGLREKNRAIVDGARVQRRDRLPFTKHGTVLAIIEPHGTFDSVTRATVRWDGSTELDEVWPVAFLVVVDEEAGADERG